MIRRDITVTIPIVVPDVRQDVRAVGRTIARVRHTLATWRARAAERRTLADMPDHLRRDMGLSLDDMKREANKPFWQG
jgi:uncharacterized protein YjiS (DUF1127 family)